MGQLRKPRSYADLSNKELIELYRFSLYMKHRPEEEQYDWTEDDYTNDYYVRSSSGIKNLEREIIRRMEKGGFE